MSGLFWKGHGKKAEHIVQTQTFLTVSYGPNEWFLAEPIADGPLQSAAHIFKANHSKHL